MRRLIAPGCIVALVAALAGCSRAPASHRNPVEDPRWEAEHGDIGAQYELGVRIAGTPASTPDFAQAAQWFRRAADQGHPGAQAALGFMYHRGQGVPRNDIEAVKWLTLAERQHSAEHDAYALWREYVTRGMGQDDVAAGVRLASGWSTSPP